MSANRNTAPPTGRKKPALGKERSEAALGHTSQNTSSLNGPQLSSGLPYGWTEQRIEQLFTSLEDGRTLHQGWSPQCDKVPSPSEETWGVLKTTSIQAGEFQPEHNKLLPPGLQPRPMIEVKEGDMLLTCAGPRVRCGVSCLVRQTRKRLMMSGKMYRFRVDPDRTDARYVEAFLQTERARQAIDKMKTGSSDSGLNLTHERFRQLLVPVAPFPEQRRIVAEIEKQFTRLEAGVAALRRMQANLKRYRAAVLKAACEGRLVPTEAELAKARNRKAKGETAEALLARILIERRQQWQGRGQYKEPAALNTTKVFQLPEGWTWTTLDALTEIKGGITKDQNRKHAAPARSVPYLRVANVQRGFIDLTEVKEIFTTEDEIRELALKPRDILFNEGGDRDKLGRGWVWNGELPECIHQNHVFRARLYVAELNPKLVSWYANTFGQKFFFDEGKHTTNLASISMSKLKGLPVPIPPPSEQTRIVAEVERRLSVVEELESVVTANLQRATRLRQSILRKAFTGELVVQSLVLLTNVIELQKAEHTQRPNAHFARALLSAEIVHRLHREPTFGRIKHQKIFHLCEHIAQMEEIQGQYHREAAGPLDNKLIYANEAELKKQKWYQEVHRESYGHAYKPLANAGNHRKYVEGYWPEKLPLIEKLIELMRSWNTDRCEIFCTTYAAWNDLLIWSKEPTEVAILREILERWDDSKKRFPEDRWRKAIGWMRKKGFVPTGFGKPTKAMERK